MIVPLVSSSKRKEVDPEDLDSYKCQLLSHTGFSAKCPKSVPSQNVYLSCDVVIHVGCAS